MLAVDVPFAGSLGIVHFLGASLNLHPIVVLLSTVAGGAVR
jgi:hypothetical protein